MSETTNEWCAECHRPKQPWGQSRSPEEGPACECAWTATPLPAAESATCEHDWVPMVGGEVCYWCNCIRHYTNVSVTSPEPLPAADQVTATLAAQEIIEHYGGIVEGLQDIERDALEVCRAYLALASPEEREARANIRLDLTMSSEADIDALIAAVRADTLREVQEVVEWHKNAKPPSLAREATLDGLLSALAKLGDQ